MDDLGNVTVRKCWIQVKISDFFVPCDLEIWWMTLKNNRAPLVYYIKLCESFRSHLWIQTWVTDWKRSIHVKICDFLSCVTLKFDIWPWKTIGHFFYAISSFVHHVIAINESKLELQFGSKSAIFCPVWPWNLTDDTKKTIRHIIHATSKLCVSFHSHWWIQTGVTVWKCPIWVKKNDFISLVTLKLDRLPWK